MVCDCSVFLTDCCGQPLPDCLTVRDSIDKTIVTCKEGYCLNEPSSF